MPNTIRDIKKVDSVSFPYIFEQNVDIPLKGAASDKGHLVRCNVYRPKSSDQGQKFPVLVTYGPYGKDIHYKDFAPKSYSEVNPEQHSDHAAWEVPSPTYWTEHGYILVRCDERGSGQSPGFLDTMSRGTSEVFYDVVEWASEQKWSTGKVGLLGISYYAGTQWRVAARRPKGLSAIIPWEGMSDYYRDRCRHGGILSNGFIDFWWNRQVITNQYGRPGRSARNWGPDTIEGDLPEDELESNRRDQTIDTAQNKYRDDSYFATKDFNLADIEVPLLSVANWGGILLHLRGNIEGYNQAGSKFKYLRAITGRHDLPFYYKEEVELQRSFLDAFLKDDDRVGWSVPGKVPPVDIVLRKGDVGFNNAEAEKQFSRRQETEWPIARTEYTKYYLTPSKDLTPVAPGVTKSTSLQYSTLTGLDNSDGYSFATAPIEADELEITGHVTATLNVSVDAETDPDCPPPSDIDLFLTLRHISSEGKEVYYTGTAGDPVPLCKGFLRVSHRKIQESHELNRPYLPYRSYFKEDVQEVKPGEIYQVVVEIWPTNVVLQKGSRLVLEVSGGDTQGAGIFLHNHPEDRNVKIHGKTNRIHFGPGLENFVTLPIIPPK